MKHLKCFEAMEDENQNWVDFMDELEDFCQTNLAYFLEEFDASITVNSTEGRHVLPRKVDINRLATITLRIENRTEVQVNTRERFARWINMKDYVIPFLHFLNRDYDIKYFSVYVKDGGDNRSSMLLHPPIEDLLEDRFEDNYSVISLDIRLDNQEIKPNPETKIQKIKSFFKRK
jgi:hypothetical protein